MPGHRCKQTQILMIESEWKVARDAEPATEITDVNKEDELPHIDEPLINLHAIATKKR
ncbi:unnamed protein product, partial [Prunus brigantina]